VVIIGILNVLFHALEIKSQDAFDAEYGLLGKNLFVSLNFFSVFFKDP
jgi:hypothetical protein